MYFGMLLSLGGLEQLQPTCMCVVNIGQNWYMQIKQNPTTAQSVLYDICICIFYENKRTVYTMLLCSPVAPD